MVILSKKEFARRLECVSQHSDDIQTRKLYKYIVTPRLLEVLNMSMSEFKNAKTFTYDQTKIIKSEFPDKFL